jgi:hypothetical protein
MPGEEGHAACRIAMRHGYAQRCRRRHAGGDSRYRFHRNSGVVQRRDFLAAPSEYERIAAFQAGDGEPLASQLNQLAQDECLRRGSAASTLADLDHARARPHVSEHAAVHEIVHQHDIHRAEHARRFQRHELRIAGPRADQPYFARPPAGRSDP